MATVVLALVVILVVSSAGFALAYTYVRSNSATSTTRPPRPSPLPASRSPARSSQPPLQDETVQRVFTAARASVVSVGGVACKKQVDATGWFVDTNLVVTNAHVVAGVRSPTVTSAAGQVTRATVTSFDPDNDIAILETSVSGAPLRLRPSDPPSGSNAVAVAFQENGPEARPGSVRQVGHIDTVDIYDHEIAARKIIVLEMKLISGDSGSPVLDVEGRVVGTAAASDADNPETAFAVPNSEIVAGVNAARSASSSVSTGPCIAD